jgi:hypothetical protein
LKCIHKFLVNEFASMSFERDIFQHHSLFDLIWFDSIRFDSIRYIQTFTTYSNIYIKYQSRKVHSTRYYEQIFSLNGYN